ncbi:unnamed protein product [Pylaiella littoralis]
MISMIAKCAVAVATLFSGASAFSCPSPLAGARQSRYTTMAAAGPGARGESTELPTSRKDVLGAVFGAVGVSSFAFMAAADAKDDPALKGTKADPEFVTCLSDCIYYCTKSKEQSRSRQECIPECRQTCAKTKAQGMIGAPRT